MISRKVTCAIMILCELHTTRPEDKTGRKRLRRTTLADICNMESKIFRQVIQQLYLSKHINMVNTLVVLTCNPAEMTIHELFEIFHGGIPLGDGLKFDSDMYSERKYPKIDALEEDVARVSRKYFERKTVASMISGRRINIY